MTPIRTLVVVEESLGFRGWIIAMYLWILANNILMKVNVCLLMTGYHNFDIYSVNNTMEKGGNTTLLTFSFIAIQCITELFGRNILHAYCINGAHPERGD